MQSSNDQHILVVDDDPDSVALLQKHLTDAGYQVLTASDGHQAIRILLSEGPLIVITDWMMPGMDGLELCRAIRDHDAIPFAFIIIVTAHQTMEDSIVEAFEAGADDYLAKPISKKELLARLRAAQRIIHLQSEVSKRTQQLHHYNAQMAVTNAKLAESNEKLNRIATTDVLTGLMNRRAVLERLADEWNQAERSHRAISCILLDLDRFKACNDAYGHEVGDRVLKETASILSRSVRKPEIVARFGGEEFLIVCPSMSEKEGFVCARRIRQAIESMVIELGDFRLHMTASLGVAQRMEDMANVEELIRAADQAMYAAKDAGRNTVLCASDHRPEIVEYVDAESFEDVDGAAVVSPQNARAVVLVADDDAGLRNLYRKILQREGYEVVEAVDGVDALTKIHECHPNVILMDVVMPNMDGLDCTKEIKNNPDTKQIPIILICARTDATDIQAGIQAGVDEFLTKPINPCELALRVKSMARLNKELSESNAVRGEQSRALALISDFAQDIAASETLEDVLSRTVAATSSLTCSKNVCVLMPDQEKKWFTLAKGMGRSDVDGKRIRIPIEEGMAGHVFHSREAIVCDSTQCSTRHANHSEESVCLDCPSISAPLCIPGHTIGVLCMSGRQDALSFNALELEYIHLICNISASAIHERITRRSRDNARYSIVVALATLAEYRDSDTGKHLERVSRFCVVLAKQLQTLEKYQSVITDEYLYDLEKAVPLHDIGKVAIPDSILLKPGSLTDEEYNIMKTHAAIGARTIRSVIERVPDVSFLNMAEDIAQSHHEWYNGKGYPEGIRGEAIPLSACITAIADVYDAISSERVYKDAIPHADALAIITNVSGQQFDPEIVEAFIACEQQFKELAEELADDAEESGVCSLKFTESVHAVGAGRD